MQVDNYFMSMHVYMTMGQTTSTICSIVSDVHSVEQQIDLIKTIREFYVFRPYLEMHK